MTAAFRRYLETLLLYYEEEIMGDAWFQALAERFEAPDRQRKMALLAAVERHAAAFMAPLLQKYALTPRPEAELHALGRAEADGGPHGWDRLIASMTDSFPGYIDDFQSLEAMAPPEDRPALQALTEHEVAAIEFLRLETAGDADSTAPLEAYLARSLPAGRS